MSWGEKTTVAFNTIIYNSGGGLNYVVNNLNKYQHNVDDFST